MLKRLVLLFFALLSMVTLGRAANTLHDYVDNSVLRSGTFVKVRVSTSGIYRLTYEDIQAMGLTPSQVRVYGYGGGELEQSFLKPKFDDLPEVPIYMSKGADGVFGAGDYILFYAQGTTRWTYESARGTFVHKQNAYSDYGYYFVTSNEGQGKTIAKTTANLDAAGALVVNTFLDYKVHEVDRLNLIDLQGTDGAGREFYGEEFYQTRTQNFSFSFPNIDATQAMSVKLDVATVSANASTSFRLSVNGADSKTLTVSSLSTSSSYTKAKTAQATYSMTPDASSLNVSLQHVVPAGESTSRGYLNYIAINAHRQLKMSGAAMFFRNVDNLGQASHSKYELASVSSGVRVWNITDPTATYEMNTTLTGGIMSFVEANDVIQQFVACDVTQGASFPKPEVVGQVENQNLHALSDVDYVILTHPDFVTQAELLAEAHRTLNNLTVEVVTTEQVYNEFSSGTPDATAYRWVMKMLYDRAERGEGSAPRYLLLMGDGTYDNRKKYMNSGGNWILTYQARNSTVEPDAYATDDYFGCLDDNDGLSDVYDKMDIAVGRFPINSQAEAMGMVEKTITYLKDENKGYWRHQLCFVGDDGGSGDADSHIKQVDYVAENMRLKNPAFLYNKIYLDAYKQEITASGESYPQAEMRLDQLLRQGVSLFTFMGHGNPSHITNERVLSVDEIKALSNKNQGFWMLGTCSFGKFDSQFASGAEEAVLNPNGGAICILTAARTVYAEQNKILLNNLGQNLFRRVGGEHVSIGEAVRLAKNSSTTTQANRLSFVLLGDPAVNLPVTDDFDVVTTKINGANIAQPDTLRALSLATIEGEVRKKSGVVANDFNGKVHIVVRDKEQMVTLLDNHNEVDEEDHLSFKDRSSMLFNGTVNVHDGVFSLQFMLPKDIRYNYGTGDINYYAYDEVTGEEGQGSFDDFYVGGGSNQVFTDTVGPAMKIYLNTSDFVNEDQVNDRPVFFAELNDQNGINSVGSGIGHDLMLIVDDNPKTSFVLNDAFATAENDYTTGLVSYKLPELAEGKHTLTFRAWDLLNNSATQSLTFEVVKNLAPEIMSISSYPNPVRKGESVSIVIEHDRPSEVLETVVYIYDVSGRLVARLEEQSAEGIVWNMSDLSVDQGMYIYHVKIKTLDSEYTSKSNKIIVVGQ